MTAHVVPYLHHTGVDPARIRYVIKSHCDRDHHGGNGAVRDFAPAAALCCHELDRLLIEDTDTVVMLRAETGCNPHDRALSGLLGELPTRSETFRTWHLAPHLAPIA